MPGPYCVGECERPAYCAEAGCARVRRHYEAILTETTSAPTSSLGRDLGGVGAENGRSPATFHGEAPR